MKTKTQKTGIYDSSGVHQLACQDCPKRYVGQIGRTFKARYKEHVRLQNKQK